MSLHNQVGGDVLTAQYREFIKTFRELQIASIRNNDLSFSKVDDEYIITSINEPDKDVVVGFSKGVMKPYKGIVKDDEAKKIIEYLKTLK